MMHDNAREKIRKILESATPVNDNSRPILSPTYRVLFISSGVISIIGIIAFLSVSRPSQTIDLSPSGGSVAVVGNITITPPVEKRESLRQWGDVPSDERLRIRAEAFALYPGLLLSDSTRTWGPIIDWMAAEHGVIATNVRDIFRAQNGTLPRFYARLLGDREAFLSALGDLDRRVISVAWGRPVPGNQQDRLTAWVELAEPSIRRTLGDGADDFIRQVSDDDH